jgi:acyl-CoA reductase-like NAD-dependent aldehyde dehydrogenase
VKGKIKFNINKKKTFQFSSTQHTTIPNVISYTIRNPVGVAVLISPWNLPLYLLTWKIAPCIAFGCTCVCKPSEFTSITAGMLAQVLNDAGMFIFYVEYRGGRCDVFN